MNWRASPLSQQHQVDVDFRVELGRQERIRRIVVLGNQHTRAGVIRRELVIRTGQPLSQDNVAESQSHLYELGMFNQVQIAPQDLPGSETEKTVLVAVDESAAVDAWGMAEGSKSKGWAAITRRVPSKPALASRWTFAASMSADAIKPILCGAGYRTSTPAWERVT